MEEEVFQETGRVVRVDGRRAEVAVVPGGGCEHCGAACLCNWTGNRERVVIADNEAGAVSGQMVVISRSRRKSVLSALLIFGLPAALMCLGVVLGSLLLNEVMAVVLAGAGLLAGVGLVWIIDRRCGADLPVIVRILSITDQGGNNDSKVGNSNNDARGGDGRS
ncbi:MAG: SoxR reducing system RseC family protein [bacterium]